MKKIILILLTLLIATSFNVQANDSIDILNKIENKIRKALSDIETELSFDYPKNTQILNIKYKTRKFMVHSPTKIGKYSSEAYETEGPDYEGFMLYIQLQDASTINQAVTPQLIKRPYWKTDLNVTQIKNTDKQIYWGLSFGNRTDPRSLERIKEVLKNLDK